MSENGSMAKETAETKSIVIVGVGGQGILLASEILAQAAMLEGYDVKTNEVHGMAQRGGSVMAQIRYGREVHSPLVARNAAHILGALEKVEALRYADYLRPDGLAAVSSQAIMPVTVSSGAAHYPEDAEELLHQAFPRLVYIDAAKIAKIWATSGRPMWFSWGPSPRVWICPWGLGRRQLRCVCGRSF